MGTRSILRSSLPYRTAAVIFPFTASFLTQGLKPRLLEALYGAAKAAPFQTDLRNSNQFVTNVPFMPRPSRAESRSSSTPAAGEPRVLTLSHSPAAETGG